MQGKWGWKCIKRLKVVQVHTKSCEILNSTNMMLLPDSGWRLHWTKSRRYYSFHLPPDTGVVKFSGGAAVSPPPSPPQLPPGQISWQPVMLSHTRLQPSRRVHPSSAISSQQASTCTSCRTVSLRRRREKQRVVSFLDATFSCCDDDGKCRYFRFVAESISFHLPGLERCRKWSLPNLNSCFWKFGQSLYSEFMFPLFANPDFSSFFQFPVFSDVETRYCPPAWGHSGSRTSCLRTSAANN